MLLKKIFDFFFEDEEYNLSKRIKLGEEKIGPPFDELADWISSQWNVTVLNILFESINATRSVIDVIFEFEEDKLEFQYVREHSLFVDEQKQNAIAEQFRLIVSHRNIQKLLLPDVRTGWQRLLGRLGIRKETGLITEDLYISFSSFESEALSNAGDEIPEKDFKILKKQLANPMLWKITHCYGAVTFFFFTDDQVKVAESRGLKQEYTRRYFEFFKRYDQFDYLDEATFSVNFDSKPNLDACKGNMYFYHK